MATETQGLTVEAWVDIDEDRAEAVQTAVAQWSFADSMDRFATYDAGSTGGLPTQGFFGAVYARGHVYFSPRYCAARCGIQALRRFRILGVL